MASDGRWAERDRSTRLIQAALFSLSVGDSHIRPSRTLPRYSHVWLALQLAKYPLALSQLAFYPCTIGVLFLNQNQNPIAGEQNSEMEN